MFNTPSWLSNYPRLIKRTSVAAFILGVAILNVASLVEARPVRVQHINCSQSTSSFIYGSPIPTPMPVNPVTGVPNLGNNSYRNCGFSNPGTVSGIIQNSILINPTLVNSQIYDSVLVNPKIVNQPVYRSPYYGIIPNIYNYPIRSRIPMGF
ncbi:MAG TPA: hypothetical protein V6D15_23150 [Oculatellaceae cyanobacterium]|jgi:hypothetical protein